MALSRKAKRRLTTLIDFMRRLPANAASHFDMSACWAVHRGEHAMDGNVTKATLMDCGTKACALGWAGSITSFRRAGLAIKWHASAFNSFTADFDTDEAKEFFDLDEIQFWDLFNDDHKDTDTTPKAWAKRAAKLVKQWSAA